MLRVRDDDATAFEELMLRYQNRVVRVIQHLVGRNGPAEDLAQDVFLRVYRSRKSYVAGAKFSTWLFTIANNVAANSLRSRSRRREVHMVDDRHDSEGPRPLEQMALEASGLMPTRQLDNSEMCDVVRLALETLNDRQRMAVLLSKFEHMSYAEISHVMDLSESAIKSLLSRARENLRDVLQPYLAHGARPESSTAGERRGEQ